MAEYETHGTLREFIPADDVEYFHQHVATGFPRRSPYPTPAFQPCRSTCEEHPADTSTEPLEAKVALLEARHAVLRARIDHLEAELEMLRGEDDGADKMVDGADKMVDGAISLLEGFIADMNRYRKSLRSL